MSACEKSVKHANVFETLRREILAGTYDVDEKFPSEQMLVRRFGVSRPTVTRALLDLKSSGFLEGRRGSGTYLGPLARTAAGYIGMIIPDRDWNQFFSQVANGIESVARSRGYTVLKDDCSAKDPVMRALQMERLAHEFALKRVRGVILEPFDASEMSDEATRRILSELRKTDIPIILLDRDVALWPARSAYDLVSADNFMAGYQLARHFLSCGARRLAFLTIPLSGSAVQERILGFSSAVVESGQAWSEASVLTFDATDRAALHQLFSSPAAPDAIGCRNDHVAAYLLQSLAALKIKVPRDVKVGAFDDCKLAELLSPPLTSVRQPAAAIAEAAFTQLLQRVENPAAPPRKVQLDVTLSPRASSRNFVPRRKGARSAT